ncbi:hypothetical protein V8C43DRAFT_270568 [Trichoderma afarasin]
MTVLRIIVMRLWGWTHALLPQYWHRIGRLMLSLSFFITCVIAMSMLRHAVQHTPSSQLLLLHYININSECAAYPL